MALELIRGCGLALGGPCQKLSRAQYSKNNSAARVTGVKNCWIAQCQLNRLHDENEAPKGKNASPRILTDTATINEMNTRARGGNPADTLHHDIDFLSQQNSPPIPPSLPCSSFACPPSYSALHNFVCNTFCKYIVPGVDLITSVGPNLFSCQ